MSQKETFSDRLIIFFIHFAFLLNIYKTTNSKDELQNIYDFNFKQIELSIREIGYGDVSINKKMKQYINLFHSIIIKLENWETFQETDKNNIFKDLFNVTDESEYFVSYFEKYRKFLINNTLNSLSKDIIEFRN